MIGVKCSGNLDYLAALRLHNRWPPIFSALEHTPIDSAVSLLSTPKN